MNFNGYCIQKAKYISDKTDQRFLKVLCGACSSARRLASVLRNDKHCTDHELVVSGRNASY
jgi:hypothetical protein